jgi:hypothetical protein
MEVEARVGILVIRLCNNRHEQIRCWDKSMLGAFMSTRRTRYSLL